MTSNHTDNHPSETRFYRRHPFAEVASLDEALVVFAAKSITAIDGDGVTRFATALRDQLGADKYVSASNLAETMALPVGQVSIVLDRFTEAGLLTASQDAYPPAVIIAALRAGRQVTDDVINQRLTTTTIALGIAARQCLGRHHPTGYHSARHEGAGLRLRPGGARRPACRGRKLLP